MKTTTLYDFTLTAGGAQIILADANMYKVLTATGDISVTRDGGATIKPLRAGRGERNVAFTRLILRDLSGAPNSGTILVGDSDFIDDTIVLSSAINVRPEAASGSYASITAAAFNAADTVFTAAANTGGAIVLYAHATSGNDTTAPSGGFIAKATAPTTAIDGQIIAGLVAGGGNVSICELKSPQFIPAGLGLYYLTNVTETYAKSRSCRYKLL